MTVEGVIHECTQTIERGETLAGIGRRMRNPMLSIFLGSQATTHITQIQDAYYSCWSDHAKHLKSLQGAYTQQNLEDAIFQTTQVEDPSLDVTTVRTVWFWDIMDDNFDAYFSCVKAPYSMPVATANKSVYFIFCSQRDHASQEKTVARLRDQLIPWAKENGKALVVLSDATTKGLLKPSGVAENYRLAASLMLLMNTHYEIGEENLGEAMTFALENGTVFSASYHGCSKNSFDIVSISLLTIIKRYRALGQKKNENYSQSSSVQNRLCGVGKTYYDLVDKIFEDTLMQVFKADARLWGDMPHTEALDGLRAQMGQGAPQKQGFLSKLFGGKSRTFSAPEAIASLGDFWKCTVARYFVTPVEKYLATEAGKTAVKDYLYTQLSSELNYDEMHELLAKESSYVRSMNTELEKNLSRPVPSQAKTADELLQLYAYREAKVQVGGMLLDWLAETMNTLCVNAGGFDELLARVQDSIREESMERSVVHAYGSHMDQLIDMNPDVLSHYMRPSKSEAELLTQLKATFHDLIGKDSKRIYFKSLTDDLQFRIENGGNAAAINVISDCFKYDMTSTGRLPMLKVPEGTLYCIMNSAMGTMGDTVAENSIGKRFIVSRSDRIERIYLFPVDPEFIMYQ